MDTGEASKRVREASKPGMRAGVIGRGSGMMARGKRRRLAVRRQMRQIVACSRGLWKGACLCPGRRAPECCAEGKARMLIARLAGHLDEPGGVRAPVALHWRGRGPGRLSRIYMEHGQDPAHSDAAGIQCV